MMIHKIFKTKSLQKHAYSSILKILQPKQGKFQIKNSDIFHISAENIDCMVGTCLGEAILMSNHNLYFRKIRKIMSTPVNPNFTI